MTLEVPTPSELSRPIQRSAALGVGARCLSAGLGFIAREPRNWPLAMVPVAVLLALWTASLGLTLYFSAAIAHSVVGLLGAQGVLVYSFVRAVTVVLGALASLVLAPALAQPLSGEALEALSRRQELALTGRTWPPSPWFRQLLRSLGVTLSSLALGLPLLGLLTLVEVFTGGIGAVLIEPVKFLVVSMMVAWDLLDYPLSVRSVAVRDRIAWIRARRWYVLGFGAAAAALMIIPGVGLLLLPAGAVGATRLVVHLDPTGDRAAP